MCALINNSTNNILSENVKSLPFSGIRKYFDVSSDVISLGVGEPDFNAPEPVRIVAAKAVFSQKLSYSANAGTLMLRKAISEYTYDKINVKYAPENEVLVTVGGSEAIDLALRAVIEPGDEIIVPVPSFVCYKPLAELLGGVVKCVKLNDKWKLDATDLKNAITDKTKAVVLPFPNNPTGSVMNKEDITKIADVLRGKDILIISDEIYAELTYGERHFSVAQILPEQTLMINGFSKAFAMTGWRLGYACGPKWLIRQMLKIHQYGIMCSPTLSQTAAVTALTDCQEYVDAMKAEYIKRRDFLFEKLNQIGYPCLLPEGAFYMFIKLPTEDDEKFCEWLVTEKKLAIVPSSAFGVRGYARISYAYSMNHLEEAVHRLA
ncbi:MAG: aminotransferase class I/II-fold pyridoxal phosphate-dependent enzyme [Ruminococcus sp.]|jgi:aminotransferase|nr:aminotransferase class I/II-fold pyridoxal phosphate-dependent enzyme [Ruminococcus sp.]